jgi:thioredoxin domain-containing protein 10
MARSMIPLERLIATIVITAISAQAVKVLDLHENLPDLIEKHDRNWLIKFYAPWCYHCQQLEPTYNNVAERVYQRHDNLIVGRVDCTKTSRTCERFGVNSFPTIKFISKTSQVDYRGDRSEESILAFADRLQGPTVNIVHSCRELGGATDKHGLVILSTITDPNNPVRKEFESLAHAYKSTHWFYQFSNDCKELFRGEGLYLLKRHLNKSIKFPLPESTNANESDAAALDLKIAILDWINTESFAIYGQVSMRNIDRAFATRKLLVISILDEHKPSLRFTQTSREFHARFELLAREYAHSDDDLLFGWSSDIELIEYITISPVNLIPNVIILKSDFHYHLLLSNDSDVRNESDKLDSELLKKLDNHLIRSTIDEAKAGKLVYNGGNTYLLSLVRYIMGNVNKFYSMYRAHPLLVSVIFGFPSLIIVFVIYTTCVYDGRDSEEEDEGYSDNEYEDVDGDRRLLADDHLKRD